MASDSLKGAVESKLMYRYNRTIIVSGNLQRISEMIVMAMSQNNRIRPDIARDNVHCRVA
jgi:hypothetical protein